MIAASLLLAAAIAGRVDAAGVRKLAAAGSGYTVVVSFWATWCAPCVKELPELAALARERKDLRFVSVSIDDEADAPQVEALVDEVKPPFPVYLKAAGPDQAFIDGIDRRWTGSLPAVLIVGPDARRRRLIEGEQTRAQIERAIAELQPRK